jgi:hypothetical protein
MSMGTIANILAAICLVVSSAACKEKSVDQIRSQQQSVDQALSRDSSIAKDLDRTKAYAPLPMSTSPHANTLGQASPARNARSAGCSNYQSLVANVWVGKELFLASDCTPIGKIADVQGDFHFPDGTVRDAILVSFADGSADWIPRKTAQLLYLTR